MKAMILAAGVGSRLDPLTRGVPKPMVPIVNRPAMEYLVELLQRHGFDEIMVNLHYLGNQIEEHFGNGSRWGVRMYFAHEPELWGDAGSVKRVERFFEDDTFLVIGGDDLTDMDLTALVQRHRDLGALATIGLSAVDDPSQYGIVLMDEADRITRFLEKPKASAVFSNTANTGVYLLQPEVFRLIPEGSLYLFGKQLFPQLLEAGLPLYGSLTDAYWKDVGDLKAYHEAHNDMLAGHVNVGAACEEVRPGVRVGADADIHRTAEIGSPVAIGNNARIGSRARVLANSVVGRGCVIEEGAYLKDTILWDGAVVMRGTHLEGCVVGKDCRVHTDAAIFDGIIVNPHRP